MYAHVVRAVAIVSAFSATGAAVAAEPRLLSQADLDRITAGSLPEGFGRILTPALVRLGLISPPSVAGPGSAVSVPSPQPTLSASASGTPAATISGSASWVLPDK